MSDEQKAVETSGVWYASPDGEATSNIAFDEAGPYVEEGANEGVFWVLGDRVYAGLADDGTQTQTVRAYIVKQLDLPADWLVIPEQRIPDTISKTTVVLQHARIEKLPEAPIGHLKNEVVLSVIDPHSDIAAAEDALDDAIVEILGAIDGHPTINWTTAEKTMHNDTYPAWNITLTVNTGRPAATKTEEV